MFKIKDLGVVKIIKMSLVEDALGSEYSTSRLANLLPEWRHPPLPSHQTQNRPVLSPTRLFWEPFENVEIPSEICVFFFF